MTTEDKITEPRAREIADAKLRQLEASLRPAGTLPTYDVCVVATQTYRHGWVFVHNARECAEEHRLRYVPDGAPLYVRDDGRVFFLPRFGRLQDNVALLEAAFEGKSLTPTLFVPTNKSDLNAAHNAHALGYPAVMPILPELLRWLQDMNWPVAGTIAALVAPIGAPLAPHVRQILNSGDEVWKYWIIGRVIGENAELFAFFKSDLERIATAPTEAEHRDEVDEQAREVLAAPPI
jgi:Domain of unknown function (DUF5071)